jgi:hypothetical protein
MAHCRQSTNFSNGLRVYRRDFAGVRDSLLSGAIRWDTPIYRGDSTGVRVALARREQLLEVFKHDMEQTGGALSFIRRTLLAWSRATSLMIGVRVPAGAGNFSLHHRIQIDSGAHPASYPMGSSGFSLGVERPGREGDHSHPSSAKVKNARSYTSTPPVRLHGVVLS